MDISYSCQHPTTARSRSRMALQCRVSDLGYPSKENDTHAGELLSFTQPWTENLGGKQTELQTV